MSVRRQKIMILVVICKLVIWSGLHASGLARGSICVLTDLGEKLDRLAGF
jgi:hypothetical protein